MDLSHQFDEMHSRLNAGGFTYDPRKQNFVTSGFSVAAHPAAEMSADTGLEKAHLQGFVMGSAPTWKQQKSRNRGQEMIGGWRSPSGAMVVDLPKVFPANPVGQQKSRQAQLLRNQEAGYSLHEDRNDYNPFHPKNRFEVQAMDDPEQRKIWADLPTQQPKYTKMRPRGESQNLMGPQQDVSFS